MCYRYDEEPLLKLISYDESKCQFFIQLLDPKTLLFDHDYPWLLKDQNLVQELKTLLHHDQEHELDFTFSYPKPLLLHLYLQLWRYLMLDVRLLTIHLKDARDKFECFDLFQDPNK